MKNINPKVSIIIPTYNQENYIAQTIESAIKQDYKDLEIVIADDQSNDNTNEIVNKYKNLDSRIKYFYNKNNLGRVGNYRKALYEYASGQYALNLDGDDLLIDRNFVSKAIELYAKFPDSKILVACKQYSSSDGINKIFHRTRSEIEHINGIRFVLNIFGKYNFSHLTTIYSRTEALKTDFYRSNIISSDMESLLRLAIKSNVIIYNKIVGQWNYTGYNESTNQKITQAFENLTWINSVHNELTENTNSLNAFLWRIRMKYIYSNPISMMLLKEKHLIKTNINLLIKYKILPYVILNIFKIYTKKLIRRTRMKSK